jgi:hypothetical protein
VGSVQVSADHRAEGRGAGVTGGQRSGQCRPQSRGQRSSSHGWGAFRSVQTTEQRAEELESRVGSVQVSADHRAEGRGAGVSGRQRSG